MRLCRHCHAKKSEDQFLTPISWCFLCRKKRREYYLKNVNREREARRISRIKGYLKNRDKEILRHKLWKKKNRPIIREYERTYYLKNKERDLERRRAAGRKTWWKNKEKRSVYAKKYRSSHKELIALAQCRRRARLARVSVNDFSVSQWEEKKMAYGYRCAYCGEEKFLTMDHVVPISKGGNHAASNIVPACKSCNSKKHNGPPLPFAISISS